MTDLIERLKAAETGSRELDVEIAEDVLGQIVEWVGAENEPAEVLRIMPLDHGVMWELPHYTTSLDAAMTLVSKGETVEIWRTFKGKCVADVGRDHGVYSGATLPLALCIAALIAREAG